MLGIYWYNGKEPGNYHIGPGINGMENRRENQIEHDMGRELETSAILRFFVIYGGLERKMEVTILFRI